MIKREDRLVIILLFIYYMAMVSLAFITQGTGDDGDSVLHFLYAKYAFQHPENFLNQWAKPMYVLLAAPFAQFGFIGIKIFNVTIFFIATYFAYKSARLLQIKNAWFVALAMCCAPMCIHLTLSGLTEPLFALALIIVIFLSLKEKYVLASLLVSFLPFFRSEGLIIICVYLLYLLFTKKGKLVPLLVVGHAVYSITGYFYYKDFLWVFNKLSYATLHSAYGEGSPMVFVYGMVDYLGWPLLILFWIGVLGGCARFVISFLRDVERVRRPLAHNSAPASDSSLPLAERKFPREEFWLIFGSFFSVWIGHVIFWWFGIFNSYGLTRVLIEIIPCAALISTCGFSAVMEGIKFFDPRRINLSGAIITLVITITPFIQLHWSCDFDFPGGEKGINKAATKYKDELHGYTIYSTAPYVSLVFNSDFFDSSQHRLTNKIFSDEIIPEKSAVIWEQYAAIDSRVALGNLMVDQHLALLDTFHSKDCSGNDRIVAVLKYIGPDTATWLISDTFFFSKFEERNFNGCDSSVALSGKYSVQVDQQNQFSPGLNSSLKQMNLQLPVTLRISANFYTRAFSSDPFSHTMIVVSLDYGDKNYFWQGFDVTNLITERHHWTAISFKINLPPSISEDDVLKVYVWNTDPIPTYVDDLLVESLRRK